MKNLTSIREKKKEYYDFIESVKKEMLLSKVYYKKAKFKCFSDNLFTYEYSDHSTAYEFSFICDDTLLDKMTIKDLLELKGVTYFDNRIFCRHTLDVLGATRYCKNDNIEEDEINHEINNGYLSENWHINNLTTKG
jgi:hypothetical protein